MNNQQEEFHEKNHLIFDKNNYKKQNDYILFVYLSPIIMGFLILLYGVIFEKSIHTFMYFSYHNHFLFSVIFCDYIYILPFFDIYFKYYCEKVFDLLCC